LLGLPLLLLLLLVQVVLSAMARSGLSRSPSPFSPGGSYCSFGVGAAEVVVDCLTGERTLLRADLMFDAGRVVSPAIDLGQVGGGRRRRGRGVGEYLQ
jgi:CO/xanthine dehydrogenase Mo-binding subunit